jgi:hypothetical protein
MEVTFKHPPVIDAAGKTSKNSFKEFMPGNIHYYPKGAGVYVYGLKIEIKGKLVFIPLYVGIAQNLQSRLWQHYCEERTGGNSKWYVFDYGSITSINDIKGLYKDMRIADSKKGLNILRFSNSMIWFNHSSFFNFKTGLTNCSKYLSNSGVMASILPNGDLDQINNIHPKSVSKNLKSSIIKAKSLFDDNYYFVYSSIDTDVSLSKNHELFSIYKDYQLNRHYMNKKKNGAGRKIAESIEKATKELLNKINIHTPTKAHGKFYDMEINLSCIQNDLINIENHCYNDKNSKYLNPLIIKK